MIRVLQGLALGGEYGGAAVYVAEHVPDGRRGFYTSFIQITATLGLFVSLAVILVVQNMMSSEDFKAWDPPGGGDEALGLVDFAMFPHLDHPDLPENTMADAEKWAAGMDVPCYAMDDETAIWFEVFLM